MATTTKITAVDNELYILAATGAGSSEICHLTYPRSFRSLAPLRVFILALLVGLTSQVHGQGKPTQVRPAPDRSEMKQDAQAQKAINDSVIRIKGLLFPKVAPAQSAKTTTTCCQPYDTRNTNGVAAIDIESPHNYSKNKDYPTDGPIQAVYSPPNACWVISSYSRVQGSTNSPYYAYDDAQPANFNYVTSSQYQSVLQSMQSYVGSLNILNKYKVDFNLKLQQFVQNYGSYANFISTSDGQVRHTARLKGRGFPNGRSWYHGKINATEVCCPVEVRDVTALKTTLKSWVDQAVKKLPDGPIASEPIKARQN